MKSRIYTIALMVILIVGLSLLLYPSVSNYINELHSSRAINDYLEQIKTIDTEQYQQIWSDAKTYNVSLIGDKDRLQPSDEEYAHYESLLNVTGTGMMGYIEIPSIGVSAPLYHGVEETVLQVAIGHIAGTSLPTGGQGTHCVVSGHRGLPSARLFTDLDRVMVGDLVIFNVLNEVMTYEVDQILIVEPHEVGSLQIDPTRDECTLVTCTPYGINTHRLLIRGHRVANQAESEEIRVTADAIQIEPMVIAPLLAVPILVIMLVILFSKRRKET